MHREASVDLPVAVNLITSSFHLAFDSGIVVESVKPNVNRFFFIQRFSFDSIKSIQSDSNQ